VCFVSSRSGVYSIIFNLIQADVSAYLSQHNLPDILHVPGAPADSSQVNGTTSKSLLNTSSDSNGNTSNGPQQPPPVPPRSFEKSFDDDFMGYRATQF